MARKGKSIQIQKEKKKKPIVCGMDGLLCYLAEIFGLSVLLVSACGRIRPSLVFYGMTGAFAFFVWWLHRRQTAAARWFDAGFILVAGWYLYERWEALYPQFAFIASAFGGSAEEIPVLEAALYGMFVLAYLLFFIELRFRKHFVVFVLNIGLLLFAYSWRISISASGVILLLTAQFGFFLLFFPGERKGGTFASGRKRTMGVLIAALLLAAVYAGASLFVPGRSESMFQGIYDLEGSLHKMAAHLTHAPARLVSNGQVSRGNNYQTGVAVLDVSISQIPEEPLYLKGFSGGDWNGEGWQEADEQEVFGQVAAALDWDDWSERLPDIFDSIQYQMTELAGGSAREKRHTLDIAYRTTATDIVLRPYFSSVETEESAGRYRYQYYEPASVQINWGLIDYGVTQSGWYQRMMDVYAEEAQREYTGGGDSFGKLRELCQVNPFETPEEVTAFILTTLNARTSYTLTPGRIPQGENIIEYFLFEGQKGYCVHYASTAVMLYRLYGIPARFASGYAVSAEDWDRRDDGSYTAVVTDESAHAWAEIFLDDYGWVPVEATPGYEGEWIYPGFSRSEMNEIIGQSDYRYPASLFEEETARPTIVSGEKGINVSTILLVLFRVAAVLLALYGLYRLGRRVYKRDRSGCLWWYSRLLRVLHASGKLKNYDGSEPHFPELLSMEVRTITQTEAERMMAIVIAETYGARIARQRENAFVRAVCEKGIRGLIWLEPWYRRPILRLFAFFTQI